MVETLKEALEDEDFLVAAIRSRIGLVDKLEDIFGDLGGIFKTFGFGGGFGSGTGTRRSSSTRGSNLLVRVNVSLEEAYTGCEKKITLQRHDNCPTCFGEGTKPGTKKHILFTGWCGQVSDRGRVL